MPLLSVIVPVYRVEPYLRECVGSILNQAFRDFELILVDDGSPDGCPAICDAFAAKDPRVKVIHQENRGIVLARRNGAHGASGKYVTFVDGDDWIDGDTYSRMAVYAPLDPDMILAGYGIDQESGIEVVENRIGSGFFTRGETSGDPVCGLPRRPLESLLESAIMTDRYYEPGIIPSLCTKWIRRELFLQADPFVDPRITVGEDDAVIDVLLFRADRLAVDNGIHGYHYRTVDNSMSRSFDDRYFEKTGILTDGLYACCAGNPAALRQLPYYTLYILEKALLWICSPWSRMGIPAMVRTVRSVCRDFRLGERLRDLDESVFRNGEAPRVRALRDGRAGAYVRAAFWSKVRGRLKKRYT